MEPPEGIDPGVSLDEEDIKLLEKARRTQTRHSYFIFSADPSLVRASSKPCWRSP